MLRRPTQSIQGDMAFSTSGKRADRRLDAAATSDRRLPAVLGIWINITKETGSQSQLDLPYVTEDVEEE
jgi:hypothetical protein